METKQLLATLELVSRGLKNNSLIPAFNYVCFTGETVFTWNDSIGVVAPCKTDKAFGVHGPTLIGLLKSSSSDTVELNLTKEALHIVSGASDFKLPYITLEEFVWKEPAFDGLKLVSDHDFLGALNESLLTCSSDQALGGFNQIGFGVENKKVVIYSFNGDACTKAWTNCPVRDEFNKFAINKDFAETIDIGDVYVNPDWVVFEGDGHRVYGRNLGTPAIDYDKDIRETVGVNNYKFVPIPEGLDDALSRARVVADAETNPTVLLMGRGKLTLDTDTPIGNVFDCLDATMVDTIEVKVSAKLFQEAIEGCDEFIILENVTIFKGPQLLRIVGNLA